MQETCQRSFLAVSKPKFAKNNTDYAVYNISFQSLQDLCTAETRLHILYDLVDSSEWHPHVILAGLY